MLLVLLGGCSEPSAKGLSPSLPSAPTEGPSTSSSASVDTSSNAAAPSSSTTSEQLDPERQAIVDAYKGFYNAIYSLKSPTDAEDVAALSPFGEDPIVQHWVKFFHELTAIGRAPGGFVTFGDIDLTVQGQTAQITECRDGTSETVIEIASGKDVGQGKPNTKFDAVLIRSASGNWLVSTAGGVEGAC